MDRKKSVSDNFDQIASQIDDVIFTPKKKNLLGRYIGVLVLIIIVFMVGGYFFVQKSKLTSDVKKATGVIVSNNQSVVVAIVRNNTKDNTLILSISGLQSMYMTVAYELTYDSQGLTQGITSRPIEITGKESFVRDDIYLGTCNKNLCRPHLDVNQVSLVLELTKLNGEKSQFSKDFDL